MKIILQTWTVTLAQTSCEFSTNIFDRTIKGGLAHVDTPQNVLRIFCLQTILHTLCFFFQRDASWNRSALILPIFRQTVLTFSHIRYIIPDVFFKCTQQLRFVVTSRKTAGGVVKTTRTVRAETAADLIATGSALAPLGDTNITTRSFCCAASEKGWVVANELSEE